VEETLVMPPHSSRYRVPLRRRREKKTDYRARKGFVVSGKPRLVSRSSLKNTVAQIIVAKPHGDEVLASAHTRELVRKFGWKAATGNIPAAYLTGLLCGFKAKKKGVSEAILDLGLVSPTKGAKVFATMKGLVDAGVDVPHDEEKVVEDRIEGEHIGEYAESLGSPSEYTPKFSGYLSRGLAPEQFSDHFIEVRNAIYTGYGVAAPKAVPKPAKAKKLEPKPVKMPEKPAVKPEAKALEAKPSKAEKPVATVTEQKPKPEMKVEEEKVKEKPKEAPKQKTKAKPEAKKAAAPAKTKADKAEKAEAKPKPAAKKPPAKAAAAKKASSKKSGGKKA
jgi:large subunit ribosomal protein L18